MGAKYSPPENHYITLDIVFATEYGTNQALLFAKLHRLQETVKGHIDENGDKWVRMTYEEWEAELPFMSRNTIIRTMEDVEEKGLVFSTVFERRSKWYRCNPEYVDIHNVSTQNGYIAQNDEEYLPKMGRTSTQNGYLPKLPPIDTTTYSPRMREANESEVPKSEFELIQDAILDVCKIEITRQNQGTMLSIVRTMQNKARSPDNIRSFGEWWKTYDFRGKSGSFPAVSQLGSEWPKYEEYLKKGPPTNGASNGHSRQIPGKATPESIKLGQQLERAFKGG